MDQENELFLTRIVDSVTDLLVVYDRDFRLLRVNQALADFMEQPPEKLIGRHCYELFYQRNARCEDCHVNEVFQTGEPHMKEKFFPSPDGYVRYFEVNSYPIKDSQGMTFQVVEHSRDISKRKGLEYQLRASEERYHTIVEMVREGTFTLNAKNSVGELIHFIRGIALSLFPDSHSLFFILNAHGTQFLPLQECDASLSEPIRRVLSRMEKSGSDSEFAQYLKNLREAQVISFADSTNAPSFFKMILNAYPFCFGLPIFTQNQCIGYFMIGSAIHQNYSREDLLFFLALFGQLAEHLRHLVFYEAQIQQLRQQVVERSSHGEIIGQSKKMQEVYELIDLVSGSDATVLITGDNGTGKELVAQAIHRQSHRSKGPFIVANCSAYSPTLLESELFGHEKGAFTGAIRQKKGRIERAHGGTLFLDEIGEIAPATQILLLRFLQDHCFERVGGEKTIEGDVRVLAATNRDLHREVKAGRFRDDLYYRLNVISIHLPSLRERKEDIALLAQHFLKKYNLKEGKKIHRFSSEAMQALMDYEWPGNVRQLENAVSHAVILAQEEIIKRKHLPRFLKEVSEPSGSTSLIENERRLIQHVLTESNWNKHEAARRLQMSRSTLYSKMRRYGLRQSQCGLK